MTAFMTPREMFYDYQDHINNDVLEYERRMEIYAEEAVDKIGDYAECIADAYCDGLKSAKKIFDSLHLRLIHAYAIQEDLTCFIMQYDETERNEPDYE